MELEFRVDDLEQQQKLGASVGMEAITLFALRNTLQIAIEDGVFKGEEEQRARELMIRIRTRIELIRQSNEQKERGETAPLS